MAKITIDGVRLDTKKATHSWELYWLDRQSNQHTGEVFVSSTNQWYVYTPSQWANQHRWELSTPEQVLSDYDRYLTDAQKTAIAEVGGLSFD